MKYILDILRAIFTWSTVIISAIITSSSILILFPFVYFFAKNRNLLHICANVWGKSIQILNPWWKFNIIGKENLAAINNAVIYVANHQSQADIIALFMLSTQFRWLAKASLFKIPLFGWAMHAVGYIAIKRGNRSSIVKCMQEAQTYLQNGIPVVFFPEGTRSINAELGPFKMGAFQLAKNLNIPIVPISIDGCANLLPKASIIPQSALVKIFIHPAIFPQDLSAEELSDKAKKVIVSKINCCKL